MRKEISIIQLLYFSDLLPDKYPEDSANLFAALEKYHVAYGFIKGAKDIRIRDFMPIQIRGRFKRDILPVQRRIQRHGTDTGLAAEKSL